MSSALHHKAEVMSQSTLFHDFETWGWMHNVMFRHCILSIWALQYRNWLYEYDTVTVAPNSCLCVSSCPWNTFFVFDFLSSSLRWQLPYMLYGFQMDVIRVFTTQSAIFVEVNGCFRVKASLCLVHLWLIPATLITRNWRDYRMIKCSF